MFQNSVKITLFNFDFLWHVLYTYVVLYIGSAYLECSKSGLFFLVQNKTMWQM
jgi:hypothetical protein